MVNVGFKQCVVAVEGYAATNPLWPWMTLQLQPNPAHYQLHTDPTQPMVEPNT